MATYLYILQSERDTSYYIGVTTNVQKRVWQHNSGGSTYTRGRRPWKLVYLEEFASSTEAHKRERMIKARKSRQYIEMLISRHAAHLTSLRLEA